ncbi:MAG: SDR family oxidoreductase [Rubripirellula sp.]|nr:SDR family oxidoreductase [Rubripirellula sp.]
MIELNGRTILITGGAGHIGRAITEAAGRAGARVAWIDRDVSATFESAETLNDLVGRRFVSGFGCDLLNQKETCEAVDRAVHSLGGVDGLIHNAAFVGTSELDGWAVPLQEQSVETWRAALEVNLTVPFYLTKHLMANLKASRGASVVMIGSIYGMVGPDQSLYEGTSMGTNPAGYGAGKGGLLQLTRYLATTMAPDVRVNSLSPGGLSRGQPSKFVERYEQRTPLGRMATEADIVGPTLFLLSHLASYITGQNLAVDGGWTAW